MKYTAWSWVLLAGCASAPSAPPPAIEELAQIHTIKGPRLSADGERVTYVSDASGRPEAWVVPASGGLPKRLTFFNERVSTLRFSPDGRHVYGLVDRGGNSRFDLFRVPTEGGEAELLTRTERNEREPAPSPDGRFLAFTADPERPFHPHLFFLDLATGEERRLTHQDPPVYRPTWSRDSRMIAVLETANRHAGNLLLVEVQSGKAVRIRPPTEGGALGPASFGPEGRLLCLTQNAQGFLQMAIVEGSTVRFVGPAEWDVEQAIWHGRAGILFVRNEGGESVLYRMSDPDASPERLYAPAGVLRDLDADRSARRLCVLASDLRRPAEIRILEGARSWAVAGSRIAGNSPSARGEMIRYPSSDGLQIHALFVRPAFARLGTPPPCVVAAHGGPRGQVRPEFSGLHEALARVGIAVLAPNFRGSSGYGKAFEDANYMDWGGGDLRDLVAGVEFLARRGEIDPARVGVMGGSFGGYLTLMALACTPEVWRAGVDAFGMPDLVVDYELSKDRHADLYKLEMGTPTTHPDLFRDRSPLTHIGKMRAPLLVFQGANDRNVPKGESDLLVESLRKRSYPVEYVVYADEGHGFVRRENRIDSLRRTVEFFVRHLTPVEGTSR